MWTSGQVWIRPEVTEYADDDKQAVVEHEIGHALGLDHFAAEFEGHRQVMHPVQQIPSFTYQSGDQNGLRFTDPDPPANDNRANAEPLLADAEFEIAAEGSTFFATAEPGEPTHGGTAPNRSVWYGWTAPASGQMFFSVSGFAFAPAVAVYDGGGTTPVATATGQPGATARVVFNALAGHTYAVAVEDRGLDGGSFELSGPPPAARFVPVSPIRLLDTRIGLGRPGSERAPAGDTFDLQVTGAHVPDGARAVVLTVAATAPTGPGHVIIYPAGTSQPTVSNLNLERAGQTIANQAIVRLPADGRLSFHTVTTTHLIADVAGYFVTSEGSTSEGRYVSLNPSRLLDTRPTRVAPRHHGAADSWPGWRAGVGGRRGGAECRRCPAAGGRPCDGMAPRCDAGGEQRQCRSRQPGHLRARDGGGGR